ncbi:MAG: AAA family ATPase [Methylococcaceae bacterium]|nr:AAA family ATPase [Methylococcaceae bacterium]
MAENETLTYHVRKTSHNQDNTANQSLITQERTQKLDLLMHLLANLTQSLVVCGPKGIGKTTLLNVLQERKVSQWIYCYIAGDSELSFEKILEQIAVVLNQGKPTSGRSLSVAFEQYERQNKKIILIIDDAGGLVPGLITTLIHYAVGNPAIRLIFVLTHDDLYLKNRTDRVIDDCHFIEIPPLSENQCGIFLHQLAAKPFSQITFNSINDHLVASIYRETHGIPGRIISALPGLAISRRTQNPTVFLALAVAVLVAAALAIQWLTASYTAETEKQVVAKSDQKIAEIKSADLPSNLSQPFFLNEQIAQETKEKVLPERRVSKTPDEINLSDGAVGNDSVSVDSVSMTNKKPADNGIEVKDKLIQDQNPLGNVAEEVPAGIKPPTTTDKLQGGQQSTLQATEAVLDSEDEALPNDADNVPVEAQPPENFTLQVMVLTKEQAVKDIIKKHKASGRILSYVKTVSANGREKFLLLYGSYASAALANKARQTLPPEFRQSYARKFGSIK